MKPVDLLYMGLGAAFLAKDKLEAQLKELEKRGEISKEEAKKFMDEAKERAKAEEAALDTRVRERVREVISELGLATKEDVEALRAMIQKS